MLLKLDTGTVNVVVNDVTCRLTTGQPCYGQSESTWYNASQSSTSINFNAVGSYAYGGGQSVNGSIYQDTIILYQSSVMPPPSTFLSVVSGYDWFNGAPCPADGVLGIGISSTYNGSIDSSNFNGTIEFSNWYQQWITFNQGYGALNMMTLNLCQYNSSISLGATVLTSAQQQATTTQYIPLINSTLNESPVIPVQSVIVGNTVIGTNQTAFIDTGTATLGMSSNDRDQLVHLLQTTYNISTVLPQTTDVTWYNSNFEANGPSPAVINQLLPSIKLTYNNSTIEMLPVPSYMILSSTVYDNNQMYYYYSFLVYTDNDYPFDMIIGASILSQYIAQIDVEHLEVGFVAQSTDCYDYSHTAIIATQNSTGTVSPPAPAAAPPHSGSTITFHHKITFLVLATTIVASIL